MPPLPRGVAAELHANAALRTSDEFSAFDGALAQVAALGDPDVIPELLAYLDDDAAYAEAMYAIVHLVESFGSPTYLPFLAQALPTLAWKAPRWAETLHKGILNSDIARGEYATVLRGAPADAQAAAESLLSDLRARKPQFGIKCAEVLSQLA